MADQKKNWSDGVEKLDSRRPAFQGHSKSRNRHGPIYHLLLVIHSNYGLISYHFWDKRRFWSKIANPPGRVLKASMIGLPLKFVTALGLE